jgi:hypothetical protein
MEVGSRRDRPALCDAARAVYPPYWIAAAISEALAQPVLTQVSARDAL